MGGARTPTGFGLALGLIVVFGVVLCLAFGAAVISAVIGMLFNV